MGSFYGKPYFMTEQVQFKTINNILTTTQMKHVDQPAINGNIDTGYSYMLAAGRHIYQAVSGTKARPK